VTSTHIPFTTPNFLRDVPDCSVQQFINKKASIFRQKESGATPVSSFLFSGLLAVTFDQNPPE
jgi:hypothetical protein